jgi:hypothetical protein
MHVSYEEEDTCLVSGRHICTEGCNRLHVGTVTLGTLLG